MEIFLDKSEKTISKMNEIRSKKILFFVFSLVLSFFSSAFVVSAETTTNIKGPTAILLAVFAFILFIFPRKYFLAPFIFAACFIPADQRIIWWGLDFTILRILVVVGVLRLVLFSEQRKIKITKFDKVILAWVIANSLIYIIQWRYFGAVINRLGFAFDVIGIYWIFRQGIRSWDDVKFSIKMFAICMLILMPFTVYEANTGNNVFTFLGRVSTAWRGENRAQASFPHSILMGLAMATLLPLFWSMKKISKKKFFYIAAMAATVIAIFMSNSSTPIGVLILVSLLYLLYKYRYKTSLGVKLSFALLILLHIYEKIKNGYGAWFIFTSPYLNFTGSSTGWHRFILIEGAVKHFKEWWLFGTRSTTHWGWGLADVTNHLVLEGVRGGLLGLVLFVSVLAIGFKTLSSYYQKNIEKEKIILCWGIFVSLIGHIAAFFGVSYFGQSYMFLYLTFAFIGFIYTENLKASKDKKINNAK